MTEPRPSPVPPRPRVPIPPRRNSPTRPISRTPPLPPPPPPPSPEPDSRRHAMPRCYMVKKGLSPLEGTPPCSPSEASVAPPCYTPHDHPTVAGPRPGQHAAPCHVGTQYEEPRGGDYADKTNARCEYMASRGEVTADPRDDYAEPRNGIYTVLRAAEFTDPVLSQHAAQIRDIYSETRHTEYSEPKPVDFSDPRQTDYSDPRHAQYTEPRSGDYAEPRTVRYLERDLSYNEPRAAEYAEPRSVGYDQQRTAGYDESRSADYAEPRSEHYRSRSGFSDQRAVEKPASKPAVNNQARTAQYESPRPEYVTPLPAERSPTKLVEYNQTRTAEYRTSRSDYSEERTVEETALNTTEYSQGHADFNTVRNNEYAELQSMGSGVREHSAADTEAAHDLLSLAAGVPPLPPAAVMTVLRAPEPVLPMYTYAIQPTSIYIIADEPNDPNIYAAAVQALAPLQQVEYTTQPQVSYITYQEPIAPQSPIEYQQLYRAAEPQPLTVSVNMSMSVPAAEPLPISMPVSVIETAPAAAPAAVPLEPAPQQLSIQVPVIEPVPLAQQHPPPASLSTSTPSLDSLSDSELDEPVAHSVSGKKNKYDCNECGKRYATSSNLSRHKQTHRSLDSQAAKRCGECGKVYVSMPALAMHVLTHRMGHVCGVCGKQFSRPWLLRGHLRSHTGEKPYNCQYCGKSFADRSNLRAHLQTHSADKKWECLRCNKTFALKSYLNKHQEAACSQDEQDSQ